MKTSSTKQACKHSHLYLDGSPHASTVGFKRATERQRIIAATKDGRFRKNLGLLTTKELLEDGMTFPGPLILPDDDLAEDPEYPPQDFREWRDEEERNPVTRERKSIYIVPSPSITQEVYKMQAWSVCTSENVIIERDLQAAEPPKLQDILEYLSAFFHGMDVKLFTKPFQWKKWDKYTGTILKTPDTERRIGLMTPSKELFGIRCRASPDGVSSMQVNLDDILDALVENIPSDAHSVMMLLDMDMYEGDDDIFTAGRAYGGSRIAAVSLFRDHPLCAPRDDGHAWPASHCAAYIDKICHEVSNPSTKQTKRQPSQTQRRDSGGPLHVAIEAATIHAERKIPSEAPTAQWLGRGFVRERYEALRRVCGRWGDASVSRMFAGYRAWLDAVVERESKKDVIVIDD
ncbi:hypothetical protein GGI35DRAFT_486392 [Trichoderma velutinum]